MDNATESTRDLVLGLDQASDHVGYAVVGYADGLVVDGGGQAFSRKQISASRPNELAEGYCRSVLLDRRWSSRLLCVALEGSFCPRDPRLWPDIDRLIELRGRVMHMAEARGLRTIVVLPREWQVEIGIEIGTKSEFVKRASGVRARQLLGGKEPEWLSEDAADAIHIARYARKILRSEELAERAGGTGGTGGSIA